MKNNKLKIEKIQISKLSIMESSQIVGGNGGASVDQKACRTEDVILCFETQDDIIQ